MGGKGVRHRDELREYEEHLALVLRSSNLVQTRSDAVNLLFQSSDACGLDE